MLASGLSRLETVQTKSPRQRQSLDLVLVLAVFLIVNVASLILQPRVTLNGGLSSDGELYFNMSRQMQHGQVPFTDAPYTYRIGTPFLASLFPFDLLTNILVVNIIANLLAVILLLIWFKLFIADWRLRVVLCALFMTQWHAPVRYIYYGPSTVDPWLFVFLLAGLLVIHHIREKLTARRIGALALLSFVGVIFRESAIVVPVASLFVINPIAGNPFSRTGFKASLARIRAFPLALFIPLVCGALGIVLTHMIAREEHRIYTSYSFIDTAISWVGEKPLPLYVLAWFIAFGPVLALLIPNLKSVAKFLIDHQYQAVFLLIMAVLGQVGGTDTERIIYWSMPIVYLLIGKAIENSAPLFASIGFVAVLVAVQAISQRLFWATPDYFGDLIPGYSSILPMLTPWSSTVPYLDLFSYRSHPSVEMASLWQYLALTGVLVGWVVYRAKKLNGSYLRLQSYRPAVPAE